MIITADAKADLREIASYIAVDSRAAALRLTKRIRDAFDTIKRAPAGFQVRDELGGTTRMLPVGAYVIVYDYDRHGDTASVLRVVHGARDLPRVLRP